MCVRRRRARPKRRIITSYEVPVVLRTRVQARGNDMHRSAYMRTTRGFDNRQTLTHVFNPECLLQRVLYI